MIKWLKDNPDYKKKLKKVAEIYQAIVLDAQVYSETDLLGTIICDGFKIKKNEDSRRTHKDVFYYLKGHGLTVNRLGRIRS